MEGKRTKRAFGPKSGARKEDTLSRPSSLNEQADIMVNIKPASVIRKGVGFPAVGKIHPKHKNDG